MLRNCDSRTNHPQRRHGGLIIQKSFLLAAILCALTPFVPSGSFAQDAPEYRMTIKQLHCLNDNREKYLSIPRALIVFSPAYCPAVGREEVAYLAQNRKDRNHRVERYILSKKDFRCLVDKISDYLVSEEPPDEDIVVFYLDCD